MRRGAVFPLVVAIVTASAVALAEDLPPCSSEIVQVTYGNNSRVCTSHTNGSDGTIIYSTYCVDPDCRATYAQLAKLYKNDCIVRTLSLQSYLSNVQIACPDIITATVPPVATTTVPPTTQAPSRRSNTITIVLAIVGSVVVILVGIILVLFIRRKRGQNKAEVNGPQDSTYVPLSDHTTSVSARVTDAAAYEALLPFRVPYHRIQFGRVISQGGYGEVLRATFDHQDVAVKRVLSTRRDEPECLRRFIKEIQLTASLHHERVVRFIGAAWREPATLCMISEFMHGGDLRKLLASYAKSGHAHGHDDAKLRIAVQIAHGLTYLHSLDPPVVHRDLKSLNVLLSEALDAKIIDFGVSCERQDYTMTAGVGTSLWMAPEVMLGNRYDEKADVCSFGVILSELDTHELPYDHARDTQSGRRLPDIVLLEMVRHGRLSPRFTDKANPSIVALARDCLELDPAVRPTAREVLLRIDQSVRNDSTLTDQTRTAGDRGLRSVLTTASTISRAFDTRATTQ